jgi:trimeric autotransporter adhesin
MKRYQSLFAISLVAAFLPGCGSTSDVVDDGKAVAELEMTPDTTILTKGATVQFHAVVRYSDGTSKEVTESSETVWNTSDPSVATVSDDGMVTAIAEGIVDISAEYKGEKENEHFAVTP